MHKLDRSVATPPTCLAKYDFKTHRWSDLDGPCKKQLRFALFQMQGIPGITGEDAKEYGLRCAYCQGAIRSEGHIEHFRRKNSSHLNGYPELTFAWENLFLACHSNDHCGHFKDRSGGPAYNPDHLLKPDEEDAEAFLYFHSSGSVAPREGLSPADKHRASETIRVFGLDNRSLIGAREKAVIKYREMLRTDLEELASWDEESRREYMREEIETTRWEPYASAIKDFFLLR
ncbi:retron system putative HNH endonuclease [Massilia sp. BJB1822]|uniref:retron system putative HNH endonuclease n=1 Tax=Massilia sp. BJB1822 TaxID=2744470 RepID=UPI001593A8C8|nr:retron system putative HNH endonuclease [Massilia sp. BJB1822]NVE01087.1 TIGR02646 family protein [Massilia sp. BJB1822]